MELNGVGRLVLGTAGIQGLLLRWKKGEDTLQASLVRTLHER